jgi:8-amino-7-oxononanoate synthase
MFSDILKSRLATLDEHSLRRSLTPRAGIDLASNDYLGFASDPELSRRFAEGVKGLPTGAAGSRLLRGELEIHEATEKTLADFCGADAALLFPSGYQANIGLLTALLRPGDTVYSDRLNHASIIDGVRLSGARKQIYPHCDVAALRGMLDEDAARTGMKLIVTESLFSMDGDFAPLEALAALTQEFNAQLIVDEAHATGMWGDFKENRGSGLVQMKGLGGNVLATIHTGGKALGAGGAWIASGAELKDYLVNYSRPFIFSTAVTPSLAVLLQTSVNYWREEGRGNKRAATVISRALNFVLKLHQQGILAKGSYIIPIQLGGNERALRVARVLQSAGFDARAIRPPTVPEGTARLRLTVTWPLSESDIERFVTALQRAV